ncbi:MAG: hypothetical protein M3M85_03030 [bacterium]|nr:hypothetical protein [bacterium]
MELRTYAFDWLTLGDVLREVLKDGGKPYLWPYNSDDKKYLVITSVPLADQLYHPRSSVTVERAKQLIELAGGIMPAGSETVKVFLCADIDYQEVQPIDITSYESEEADRNFEFLERLSGPSASPPDIELHERKLQNEILDSPGTLKGVL